MRCVHRRCEPEARIARAAVEADKCEGAHNIFYFFHYLSRDQTRATLLGALRSRDPGVSVVCGSQVLD